MCLNLVFRLDIEPCRNVLAEVLSTTLALACHYVPLRSETPDDGAAERGRDREGENTGQQKFVSS